MSSKSGGSKDRTRANKNRRADARYRMRQRIEKARKGKVWIDGERKEKTT